MVMRLAALVLLLFGCASVPSVPVCAERFGVVCRAPAKGWEKGRMCPWEPKAIPAHPLGACYVSRGMADSRAVYEYVAF